MKPQPLQHSQKQSSTTFLSNSSHLRTFQQSRQQQQLQSPPSEQPAIQSRSSQQINGIFNKNSNLIINGKKQQQTQVSKTSRINNQSLNAKIVTSDSNYTSSQKQTGIQSNVITNKSKDTNPLTQMSPMESKIWEYILKLHEQFQILRSDMNSQIQKLQFKVDSIEQKKQINSQKSRENIDEEYKSQKREINELSIHSDSIVPPNVKLNLKALGQASDMSKQLIIDLKQEICEVIQNLINFQQKNTKHQFVDGSKLKDFIQKQRPQTSLKDSNANKALQKLISPKNQDEVIDLEGTQVIMGVSQINNPMDSPQRILRTVQQQNTPKNQDGMYITNDMTLSEKIQQNNFLNHLSKKQNSLDEVNSLQIVKGYSNKNISPINKDKKAETGMSSVIESPKFLQFINDNTSRKSSIPPQSKQESHHLSKSFKKAITNHTVRDFVDLSQVNHINQDSQYPTDQEDNCQEQLTERGSQPNISEKVSKSSRAQITQQTKPYTLIQKRVVNQNNNSKYQKNPLFKSYINNKPNQGRKGSSNLSDEDDDHMESDECDEKRSFTPEPTRNPYQLAPNPNMKENLRNQLNHSSIGIKGGLSTSMSGLIPSIGVNSVYKSSKMEISKYISNNKSKIDYQNSYNLMEYGGYKAILENKGSKCTCHKQQAKNREQKCGKFCKQLNAHEQKQIIIETVFKEGQVNSRDRKIKRYLIDAKWLRKWSDYTNFDTNLFNSQSQSSLEQAMTLMKLDNSKQDSQRSIRYDSSQLYSKPEKIENQNLLDPDFKGHEKRLRENIVEHFDFHSMSPQIWLFFYSWYSADCQVVRYLKRDKFNSNQYILDLYPHLKKEQQNLSYIGPQQDDSSETESDEDRSSPQLRQKQNQPIVKNQDEQLSIVSQIFSNLQSQNSLSKSTCYQNEINNKELKDECIFKLNL